MANLLTKETRAERRWDYYARLAVLGGFVVSGALALGGVLLLSAYVYIRIVAQGQRDATLPQDDGALGVERQALTQQLKDEQSLIVRAGEMVHAGDPAHFLAQFTQDFLHQEGLALNTFHMVYVPEAHTYTADVAGEAQSRDAVVRLRGALEQASYLTLLDFPIANFTPAGDAYEVVFSVTFKE